MSVSVNLYPDPRGKKSINKPTGLTNYLFVFTIFAWSVQLINLAHCDVWWQEIKAHVHGYLWLVRQHQSFVSGWGRGYSLHTVLLQHYANYNVYILDTFGQMRKKNQPLLYGLYNCMGVKQIKHRMIGSGFALNVTNCCLCHMTNPLHISLCKVLISA